ncbi:hypothetical protein BG015_009938 [Linnemannia schmuckeri]|uniref:Uncharacterized protein n=1 Tax=Linnemannia schmuckeri TaxID=64567 RepID=A0A9P5RY78_9FUNG|nr:hypothetical protein BG015_009938 [Linnemannia schmuckeri]
MDNGDGGDSGDDRNLDNDDSSDDDGYKGKSGQYSVYTITYKRILHPELLGQMVNTRSLIKNAQRSLNDGKALISSSNSATMTFNHKRHVIGAFLNVGYRLPVTSLPVPWREGVRYGRDDRGGPTKVKKWHSSRAGMDLVEKFEEATIASKPADAELAKC